MGPTQLTPSQLNYSPIDQWKQAVKQSLADLRCSAMAFLAEDMNPDDQFVTVQIAIQERVRTGAGPQWWDVPPIIRVPIQMVRGGGWCITTPLKKGDEGILIFCDTCFDNWWMNGQENGPKAANVDSPTGTQRQFEVRRHDVTDCGFIPGFWSQKRKIANYSNDSLQIRSDDGTISIDVAMSGITLTAPLVTCTQNLQVGNGATGSFTTPTGQTVTVQDGIITNIY